MSKPTRVIVIGAGWSGLIAAATYLRIAKQLSRAVDITILDEGKSPGGVWAKERLYPGLTANSPNGLFECSHMSMVDDEHPFAEVLPGERVRAYLEEYAEREGLLERIRWGVRVKRCARKRTSEVEGWVVESLKGEVWQCEKLIVASGLYSKARVPEIPEVEWEGVSVHSKDLGRMQAEVRRDEKVKSVVVVGGCKSAIEACALFLPHLNPGREFRVSWVVRPGEKGVPMVVQDMEAGAALLTVGMTRLFGCLSPSVFCTEGFWYWFLHSGKFWPGFMLLHAIWYLLSWALKRDAKYRSSENGTMIEPKGKSMFYDLNVISLVPKKAPFLEYLHQDDERVLKVHRVVPVELRGREMVVVDEEGTKSSLPCDVVIWCTGWLPSADFFDYEEAKALGVPTTLLGAGARAKQGTSLKPLPTTMLKPAAYRTEGSSDSDKLAEQETLRLFPMLGTEARRAYPLEHSGSRLYRQILPTPSLETGDRSIVFVGLVSNGQTAVCCELTSLWAVAWMEGLLPPQRLSKSKAEADWHVDQVSAWMRRRYGPRGMRDSEIVVEVQSYFDLLCNDLGVAWERKNRCVKRAWWEYVGRARDSIHEWTAPYTGQDYQGIIQEFLENNGHMKKAGNK